MITQDGSLRCDGCHKKLASELKGEVRIVCSRCKTFNVFKNKGLTLELFCEGMEILLRDKKRLDKLPIKV